MKRFLNLKALVLSFVLVMLCALPVSAQKSDDFFRVNDDFGGTRDVPTFFIAINGIATEDPTAPLGSGLLIMLAAGTGYAVVRRKRIVHKGTLPLLALVLTLGMTQCKKTEVTPTPTGNGIHITLNANMSGEKTVFTPSTGTFTWSGTTEYINVGGSESGYLGQLNCSNGDGNFSGNLNKAPQSGETLYFFYLGKGSHEGTELNFSDQYGTLDDITDHHIAIGSSVYTGSTSFSVTLETVMSIAYFDLSGFKNSNDVAETVYLHGNDVYAAATINYNAGTITGSSKGFINIGTATEGQYVALIPSGTTAETTLKFESNSKTGSITFINGIEAGKFYSKTEGETPVALTISAVAPVEGSTPGLFTVGEETVEGKNISKKMVRFAKGNLQCTRVDNEWGDDPESDWTWSFMEHQYSRAEGENQDVGDDYENQDIVSLFGWGCTGYQDTEHNEGETMYRPYYTDNSSDVIYGPTGEYDLSVTRHSDWGWCMGKESSRWYTLSNDEWNFIALDYTNSWSTVNGVNGWVVLNSTTGSIEPSYTSNAWASLEAYGAIFLPAAGRRTWENDYNATEIYEYDESGYYWSSAQDGDDAANGFYIIDDEYEPYNETSIYRSDACAVRLAYLVGEY